MAYGLTGLRYTAGAIALYLLVLCLQALVSNQLQIFCVWLTPNQVHKLLSPHPHQETMLTAALPTFESSWVATSMGATQLGIAPSSLQTSCSNRKQLRSMQTDLIMAQFLGQPMTSGEA